MSGNWKLVDNNWQFFEWDDAENDWGEEFDLEFDDISPYAEEEIDNSEKYIRKNKK